MSGDRFMLIKPWSYRLWSDVEHILGQLLIAEITNRIPVIYWPTHCLHNGFIHTNGFELYFEPVSNYSIFDLTKPGYTFYPPFWDADNLLVEDTCKDTWMYRSIGDLISSNANVVVGDVYFSISEIIPFIMKDNAAYGMTAMEIYRYLYRKYIVIKRDILMEVQGYYQSWLRDGHPLLAVHVRREEDDMIIDERKDIADEHYWHRNSRKYGVKDLKSRKRKYRFLGKGKMLKANIQYHAEIKKLMNKYSIGKIFLLTDSGEVAEEYRKMYGDMVVYTDSKRLTGSDPVYNIENPMVKRRRGIEVIKDALLAAECDFFIGNDFSSLSRAISRIKDWPEGNIKLLFRQRKKRKYPVNVKMIVSNKKKRIQVFVEFIKNLYRKIAKASHRGWQKWQLDRFLLIKSWGCGFWSDVDHVMGRLLAAELTNRIPVVYWESNSLYSESFKGNAFELYFEPVSNYTIEELNQPGFTYYPPIWNGKNLKVEDLDKVAWAYRNLGDLMQSDANVVVSDTHYFLRPILHYIPQSHWAYGMTAHQIYRCLFDKYIRLKPDIQQEIQEFYDEFMKDSKPLLGVHIRGGDKVKEVENLSHLNKRYHQTIRKFVRRYGIKKILLLTDCEEILNDFQKRYGKMVIFTDCKRGQLSDTQNAPHLTSYSEKRRKGIEIIKDTYLASMCDFFIGNGYSNVSYTVKRLRDWTDSNIVLFYRTLKQEQKLAKKRVKADRKRRKSERIHHRAEYPELYGGVNTYADEPIFTDKITG